MERTVNVRIESDSYERLEELAERDDRTVSYIVRLAIDQYLNRRKAGVS